MVLDAFGDLQAESRVLADDVVVTTLEAEKLALAPGCDLRARRPEPYARLVDPLPEGQASVTKPGWDMS